MNTTLINKKLNETINAVRSSERSQYRCAPAWVMIEPVCWQWTIEENAGGLGPPSHEKPALASCGPRRGFTLIELLVVMAIIVILAGMLLPVLGKARAQAQSAKCQSNQRQIAASYLMYSSDNADFLPEAAIYYQGGEVPLGWFVQIAPYINCKNTNIDNILNPISAQNTVIACPTANLQNAIPTNAPGWLAYGGYGHNFDYLGYQIDYDPAVKTTQVTLPSTCCMNADALDPAPGLQFYNLGYLYPSSQNPFNSSGGPYAYARHGNGDNYSWADGHVSLTSWKIMSQGMNGDIDWFYKPTPTATRVE